MTLSNSASGGRAGEMAVALRAAGLRLTAPRLAVCRALARPLRRAHPTAQQVYDYLRPRLPRLSRATVYNTLRALVQTGLVQELGTAGDAASHYDPNPTPHVNLVCTRCHRVDDLPEAALRAVGRRARAASGYQLRDLRVVYSGLCPACQRAAAKISAR